MIYECEVISGRIYAARILPGEKAREARGIPDYATIFRGIMVVCDGNKVYGFSKRQSVFFNNEADIYYVHMPNDNSFFEACQFVSSLLDK